MCSIVISCTFLPLFSSLPFSCLVFSLLFSFPLLSSLLFSSLLFSSLLFSCLLFSSLLSSPLSLSLLFLFSYLICSLSLSGLVLNMMGVSEDHMRGMLRRHIHNFLLDISPTVSATGSHTHYSHTGTLHSFHSRTSSGYLDMSHPLFK